MLNNKCRKGKGKLSFRYLKGHFKKLFPRVIEKGCSVSTVGI